MLKKLVCIESDFEDLCLECDCERTCITVNIMEQKSGSV